MGRQAAVSPLPKREGPGLESSSGAQGGMDVQSKNRCGRREGQGECAPPDVPSSWAFATS